MNKIIGGLLVVAMLSSPRVLQYDFLANEMYKANESLINFLKSNEEKEIGAEDIEFVMNEIDENRRYISLLIDRKKECVNDIEEILIEKSSKKVFLTDEQVEKFNDFKTLISNKNVDAVNSMSYVTNEDFNDIQKEVLHTDVDYEYIYYKFYDFYKNQSEVIDYLTSVINEANLTKEILC